MCDHTSWLVWNLNMVRDIYLFYTMSMYLICMYLNWLITNCIVRSLHNEHSHPYTSFQMRRHYTSLNSSQFFQMYIVPISQRKEHRLFWNVNAYFMRDVASPFHTYSRLQIKLLNNGSCVTIAQWKWKRERNLLYCGELCSISIYSIILNRGRLNVHCAGSYCSNYTHFSMCFACNSYSLVLILRIPMYLGSKGGQFF